MLDENVAAYDHTKLDKVKTERPKWKSVLMWIGIVLACILALPFIIVFFVPINCAYFLSSVCREQWGCAGAVFGAIAGIILGFPIMAISLAAFLPIGMIVFLVIWIVIGV